MEPPTNQSIVGSHWFFDIKRDTAGEITHYKAHFVVKGFTQIPGIDFNDTFSPTVCLNSLQTLLHLSASFGWSQAHDDVHGAFLHSEIDHDIYIRQPEGFDDQTGHIAHLLHGLYGLKQASHLWNKLMHGKLVKLGWTRLETDPAVYRHESKLGASFLAIHVDNFWSFAESPDALEELRAEFHLTFEMKEEDPGWLKPPALPTAKTTPV